MRACRTCAEQKPADAFYAFINRHGKTYRRGSCKDCICRKSNEKSKAWYQANKVRHSLRTQSWYAANKEKGLAYAKRSRDKNPERFLALVRERYAKKLNAMPAWANAFFIEEAYELARLRTDVTGIKWQVDHMVPLQHPRVCGLHVEHNLQVIPAAHNREKGNSIGRAWRLTSIYQKGRCR